jgi:type 1 fimbriae regulatory protein FimB/type 1 fimbriae regulatory protein FimE
VHPISARESRALRKLLREAPTAPYVFISERRAPLSVAGYQRMVARAGVAAKFTFLVHSHMLRHACGFKLAKPLPSDGILRVKPKVLCGFG